MSRAISLLLKGRRTCLFIFASTPYPFAHWYGAQSKQCGLKKTVRALLPCYRNSSGDFYFMILHHHPHVAERAFRPKYEAIKWHSDPSAQAFFEAWCNGKTGYPLVDAAIAQLNQTGYMHNRGRMVTASFLIKDWYQLAMGSFKRMRCSTLLSHLQPSYPITEIRSRGEIHQTLPPPVEPTSSKYIHVPWLAPIPE